MLSDTFYLIIFYTILTFSIVGFFIGFLDVFIIVRNQRYRTVPNLLVCNTCIVAILFFCNTMASCIAGFQQSWAMNPSTCVLRAYCLVLFCNAFIYSYMIQSISRFFFIIYYQKLYLCTWSIHWYMIISVWIISIVLPIKPLYVGAYIYQSESRLCIPTPRSLPSALCIIILGFLIPHHSIMFSYIYIVRRVRSLSSRIVVL